MRDAWRGVLLASVLFAALAAVAAPAWGLHAYWGCTNKSSASTCYENTLTDGHYRGWIATSTDIGTLRYEVCTKAITAAGNVRSTTAGTHCNINDVDGFVSRCLISPEPTSWAYSYWAGTGGNLPITASALSPSESGC